MRDSAHKSRAGWAVISLGVYMSERQHIYEDLNESSSASPGGSQQLEIPPSPNSKQAANLFRWYFSRRGDFNARQDSIVRLYFGGRQYFVYPPIFWRAPIFCISANILEGANILYSRQYFHETPIIWKSAYIFISRQYFHETPIIWGPPMFYESANNLWICWFCCCKYLCIFSVFILCIWVCANIFGAIVLTLGLKLIL